MQTPKGRKSIFHGVCVEILVDHEGDFENDSVVEFSQIETGELFDFLKTVYEGVAVDKKLSRGFGNVEVVVEKALNGEEGLLVEAFDRVLFKDLAEE